jgi:hypothetical protein
MNLPVTLLYGGLTGLLLTLLGLNVSLRRLSGRVRSSQPVPPELWRPWRAHGNAAEWIPLGLVLLLALELSGRVGRFPLHLLGGTFLLARALHAAGLLTRWRLSTLGATLNYLVLAVMAGLALWLRFTA